MSTQQHPDLPPGAAELLKDAHPAPYFDLPPYHVEHFPAFNWFAICNKNGFNCLQFYSGPGCF